jgi:hypothetical protein
VWQGRQYSTYFFHSNKPISSPLTVWQGTDTSSSWAAAEMINTTAMAVVFEYLP